MPGNQDIAALPKHAIKHNVLRRAKPRNQNHDQLKQFESAR
jgi:hypothetical protein